MIGAFLGKGWDSADVFDNLYISDESRYRKYLNHYNVIYIDFSRLPENCTSYQQYISRISEGLKHDLLAAFPDISTTNKTAVWDLLAIISAKYDTQFVFVMDEWDAVFHLPFITDGEKEEYILFLKSLLKDQEYVALAYITGILPIAKYSSGSELNMFMEFKMTSMAMFGEYFGFTDEEVDVLYEKYLHLCKDPQVSRESLRSEKSLGYVYRLASISDQMLKATLSGDADRMAEILQLAHNTETQILSYNNETELAAVVNLVYLSARDRYRVEREDKAGKGFVDFIFYPVIFDGQTPPG